MPSEKGGCDLDKAHAVPMALCNRGWLSHRRKCIKQAAFASVDDFDGLPVSDDILLHIFASFKSMADLIRCAATCRRWRCIVSGNASYICHSTPLLDRKSCVILELRRVSLAAVLRLAVWNPMTGDVSVLPALSGKDRVHGYAYTLHNADDLPCSSSSFSVVLVYHRRSFLACHSYSSDTKIWGPEGRITGAKISSKHLQKTNTTTVVRNVVFWND
ncbi:hypothetical protein E2562_031894 [Oryza meyeriana var. granulata]|uniref:F-box domain-containing protein n=1 Tax=Oryza meyeriana var. granulata TaxID=110450 RepID=A0A6G1F0C4_9ORYZ|nr:hypothetical protein E2562_031894 [Oryza meyeriana var. granulata]